MVRFEDGGGGEGRGLEGCSTKVSLSPSSFSSFPSVSQSLTFFFFLFVGTGLSRTTEFPSLRWICYDLKASSLGMKAFDASKRSDVSYFIELELSQPSPPLREEKRLVCPPINSLMLWTERRGGRRAKKRVSERYRVGEEERRKADLGSSIEPRYTAEA